jgi:hypothetical protein
MDLYPEAWPSEPPSLDKMNPLSIFRRPVPVWHGFREKLAGRTLDKMVLIRLHKGLYGLSRISFLGISAAVTASSVKTARSYIKTVSEPTRPEWTTDFGIEVCKQARG